MRRYTNWGLIFIGGLLAMAAVVSPIWIPVVQPYLVDEAELSDFVCPDYVSDAQCGVLQQMYEEDPDTALQLSNLINPDNDFAVSDMSVEEVAAELQDIEGSSDVPHRTIVKEGFFREPIDAIHNASGTVRIYELVTLDEGAVRRLVRLDSAEEEGFSVTYVPDLTLYLSQHTNPMTLDDVFSGEGGALEVGQLKGNKGQQNYLLDLNVDFSRYWSVVIYSPSLEQIFGVAPIN